MKQVSKLLVALLLIWALPVWAAPMRDGYRKPYEERSKEEIKAELDELVMGKQQEIIDQITRMAGLSATEVPTVRKKASETVIPENSASAAAEPHKSSEPSATGNRFPEATTVKSKTPERKKPARHLRRIHREARVAARNMPEEQVRAIAMKTLIKNGVKKIEQENQQSKSAKPKVVKLNPQTNRAEPDFILVDDDGMREIELDLPLHNGNGKHRKKEKIKIKAKPEVMAIHRQIQGLNQMLIDDVVRMTGKPLQKGSKQKVRRK